MAMGGLSRIMALGAIGLFLACTAIGSVLPEFGNLLAQKVNLRAHYFNIFFLIVGIIGVGVALYLGYKHDR